MIAAFVVFPMRRHSSTNAYELVAWLGVHECATFASSRLRVTGITRFAGRPPHTAETQKRRVALGIAIVVLALLALGSTPAGTAPLPAWSRARARPGRRSRSRGRRVSFALPEYLVDVARIG